MTRGGDYAVSRRSSAWTLFKVSLRLALILMTCSLFLCREVRSPRELANVPLGLPIPFVALDARARAPPDYPACLRFGNPHDDSMRLRPLAALADLVLLTLALMVATRLVARRRGLDRGRTRSGAPPPAIDARERDGREREDR